VNAKTAKDAEGDGRNSRRAKSFAPYEDARGLFGQDVA
jgi:hypothetical protein